MGSGGVAEGGNDGSSQRVRSTLEKSVGHIVAGGCAGKPAV